MAPMFVPPPSFVSCSRLLDLSQPRALHSATPILDNPRFAPLPLPLEKLIGVVVVVLAVVIVVVVAVVVVIVCLLIFAFVF
jgi:hypothetical protein